MIKTITCFRHLGNQRVKVPDTASHEVRANVRDERVVKTEEGRDDEHYHNVTHIFAGHRRFPIW